MLAEILKVWVLDVVSCVAQAYSAEMKEVLARKRSSELDRVRNIAFYVAHRTTGYSKSFVARAVKRDPSTLQESFARIEEKMKTDRSFRKEVETLITTCRKKNAA